MNTTIEKMLKNDGYIVRPISGDSMMPLLDEKKDAVKIVKASFPLKKFALPLYRRPNGQYVLHRAIKVKKDYVIACGDNRFEKERVPNTWIIGLVDGIYKEGRYIDCNDKEYLKYVKRHCTAFHRFRLKIKFILKRIKNYRNKK